jgi:2-methylisocitrate lyase-like PEP mutase family enzyme
MSVPSQKQKAELFLKLHSGGRILALPNAWDVVSARIWEDLGYPAIATTSAGVAAVLGYPDGQNVSRDEMLEAVQRIVAAVHVPVTADMESGYGSTPEQVAEAVKALLQTGAVGMNLEDVTDSAENSQVELPLQVEKITAARKASADLGVPLVLNARTDIYLNRIGDATTRCERTVERLRAYRSAGADCVFAPGVSDASIIAKLVASIDGPINILVSPGCPKLKELQLMGVARASTGSSVMRATLGLLRRIGRELMDTGEYTLLFEGAIPYAEVNQLLARSK